jgi:hypothetical protein
MVDKIQTQSIDFLGEDDKKTFIKQNEAMMIDLQTQIAMGELNKNYNRMINNMLASCANICLKNFSNAKFTQSESVCVENCQKKYYSTYAIGEYFVRYVLEESKKTDFFSNKTEVDIIENAQNKLNNLKF